MPKYSDYREWENYTETLMEENKTLIKLGFKTKPVPILPEEGIVEWLEKQENK